MMRSLYGRWRVMKTRWTRPLRRVWSRDQLQGSQRTTQASDSPLVPSVGDEARLYDLQVRSDVQEPRQTQWTKRRLDCRGRCQHLANDQ